MKKYKVELRASPDLPIEEERAKSQGRTLSPQTVVWYIYAKSSEEASVIAIERELSFLYRKNVVLFCAPIEIEITNE